MTDLAADAAVAVVAARVIAAVAAAAAVVVVFESWETVLGDSCPAAVLLSRCQGRSVLENSDLVDRAVEMDFRCPDPFRGDLAKGC